LKLRRDKIVPLLSAACSIEAKYEVLGVRGLRAYWKFKDGAKLTMLANLGADPLGGISAAGSPVFRTDNVSADSLEPDSLEPDSLEEGELPAWSVVWSLES